MSFVHLRLHTQFSIRDGILQVKPLMQQVREYGMPAVAMTDSCNLFGLVKFYRAAIATGIKPIVGAEVYLRHEHAAHPPYSLLLLCQNQQGFLNLCKLISMAYIDGQSQGLPLLDKAQIAAHSNGLLALSGGMQGDIAHALLQGNTQQAIELAQQWMNIFPQRFYLELQRIGVANEAEYNQAIIQLAQQQQLPVVATNSVCFLKPEDFEAHEARVCIYDGVVLQDKKRKRQYSAQQYLRSAKEMAELFADVPQALQNSVEIAKRCNLQVTLGKTFLPDFPVPAGQTTESHLAACSQQGLEKRLQQLDYVSDEKKPEYTQRLQIELAVINQMGFAGYFLIVADFIQWSKDNDIPVGPGRGSGAGSLVAYALGITDLDPLKYDLLFERFLNPERVSMPDFDIDFCMEGRDRVIDYVAERYGRDSVSQIITFGTMAAKAVVRDVGRVLSFPYGFVDKLAKLIPFELGITLEKALAQEETLQARYDEEEEVRAIIDLARKLEGVVRNAGKHAGGVVIAPSALTDFVPLYCEPGGANLVTQLDKDDVEAIGLVKFDFLGLRTLTIIHWALQTINQQRAQQQQAAIDIHLIPTDDKATFDLLKRNATTAVFQLESRGMKDLIKRLQPDCFEDIIALVALFRPGPLQSGMVDDFIDRKHGRASVEYMHPSLENILSRPTGLFCIKNK
jgi:DNA polymerase-3 subunit alpha